MLTPPSLPKGDVDPQVLQGIHHPDSTLLAGSTVVRGTDEVMSISSPVGVSLPLQQSGHTTLGITMSSRLDFPWGGLSEYFFQKVVGTMLRAHCPSAVRQYESCSKRFSVNTVLGFLTWVVDSTNRAPAMILAHYVTLADPLLFRLILHIPEWALSLLMKGISTSREPRSQAVLAWFLHRVPCHLTFSGVPLEERNHLQRAAFLLTLATGYRASLLALLSRHPSFSLM